MTKKYVSCIWVGCIVMGLAYLVGFDYDKEATPFVIGQVVLGVVGLIRENVTDGETKTS